MTFGGLRPDPEATRRRPIVGITVPMYAGSRHLAAEECVDLPHLACTFEHDLAFRVLF